MRFDDYRSLRIGRVRRSKNTKFDMVPSTAAVNAGCLTNATAHVSVKSRGPVEVMKVRVSGLLPDTDFDL
jgi:hypothetical protein